MPLLHALGVYHRPLCEPIYYFEIGGKPEGYRLSNLTGLAFLLRVHNDSEHWRQMFTRPLSHKFDTAAALAWIIRTVEQAGPYDPPEHLKPRGRGRPKKDSPKPSNK